MTDERWKEIKDMIEEQFEVLDKRVEDFSDRPGTKEVIEFLGPMGKIRLERTDQPLLLGKKTIGSRRIGSETTVQYIYSDTERIKKLKAYRWDEPTGEWLEIEIEKGVFTL